MKKGNFCKHTNLMYHNVFKISLGNTLSVPILGTSFRIEHFGVNKSYHNY